MLYWRQEYIYSDSYHCDKQCLRNEIQYRGRRSSKYIRKYIRCILVYSDIPRRQQTTRESGRTPETPLTWIGLFLVGHKENGGIFTSMDKSMASRFVGRYGQANEVPSTHYNYQNTRWMKSMNNKTSILYLRRSPQLGNPLAFHECFKDRIVVANRYVNSLLRK